MPGIYYAFITPVKSLTMYYIRGTYIVVSINIIATDVIIRQSFTR